MLATRTPLAPEAAADRVDIACQPRAGTRQEKGRRCHGPKRQQVNMAITGAPRRGGTLACEYWMGKGLKKPRTFAETVDVVCRHIDRIHQVAGSHDVAAIGSDQDGFHQADPARTREAGRIPETRGSTRTAVWDRKR